MTEIMINVAVGINMEANGNCAGFFPSKTKWI